MEYSLIIIQSKWESCGKSSIVYRDRIIFYSSIVSIWKKFPHKTIENKLKEFTDKLNEYFNLDRDFNSLIVEFGDKIIKGHDLRKKNETDEFNNLLKELNREIEKLIEDENNLYLKYESLEDLYFWLWKRFDEEIEIPKPPIPPLMYVYRKNISKKYGGNGYV